MTRSNLDAELAAALLEQEEWVRRVARCLVGGDADVDDVVQDTYVRALTYPPIAGTRIRNWIAQVTRNVVREQRKKASREKSTELPDDLRDTTASADQLIGHIQTQRRIAGIVLALDEPYRSAIVLRYYDNESPSQMAASLGCPVETVRTRVKRGLARIRSEMDRESESRQTGTPWQAAVLAMLEQTSRGSPGRSQPGAVTPRRRPTLRLSWPAGATVLGLLVVGLGFLAVRTLQPGAPTAEPWRLGIARAGQPEQDSGLGWQSRVVLPAAQPLNETSPLSHGSGGHRLTGVVVVGDSGAAVASANVRIVVWDGQTYHVGAAVTDASGQFDGSCDEAVSALPDALVPGESWTGGTYVIVTAPGLATAVRRLQDAPGPAASWTAGKPFDAGTIPMFLGTRLQGRAIVEATGAPVNDGQVFLCESYDRFHGVLYYQHIAATRADGSWAATDPVAPRLDAAGTRTVVVISPSRGEASQEIVIPAMPQMLMCDVEFPEPGQMDVFVGDEQGQPIKGAIVVARPLASLFWASGVGLAPHDHEPGTCWRSQELIFDLLHATTGADGHVVLPLLPMQRLGALAGGTPAECANIFEVCSGIGGQCHGDTSPQVVHAGERVSVSVVVHRQAASAVSISGRVIDIFGQPAVGARVVAAVNTGQPVRGITDETGCYAVQLAPRFWSSVLCRAEKPGLAPREIEVAVDESTRMAHADFALAPCEPIRGRVVDPAGFPVSGAELYVRAADDPAPPYPMAPERIPNGVRSLPPSDAEGRFEIAAATGGAWHVTIWAPSERRLEHADVIALGGADGLVVCLRADQSPPREVILTAVTESGRRLIPVDASLMNEARDVHSTDDPRHQTDSFVFERVDVGSWRAWVSIAGGDCGYADFDLGGGDEALPVSVVVGPPGSIRIEVGSAEGACGELRRADLAPPVDWMSGEMRDLILHEALNRRPDENGLLEFRNLAPGLYAVRLERGSDVALGSCAVTSGKTSVFIPAWLPWGRLLLRAGKVPPNGSVEITLRGAGGWVEKHSLGTESEPVALMFPAGPVEWATLVEQPDEPPWDFTRDSGISEVIAGESLELALPVP